MHFPKKTITVRFSKDFFVVSHFELDKLTANLAQKVGTKIILNHNVSSLPQGFDRIIGCDGANSFVRKSLNLPTPNFRLAIQGFIKKESLLVDYVEVWPCKDGFLWKIPRGNKIEYGIIANPQEARNLFNNFIKNNNLFLEEIKAKIIPQGFLLPSNNSVTLCGDAAGLTKPWSGGGVIWGLTAAEILLKTFPDFLAYRKKMKKFFIPKIIISKAATKLAYFTGFKTPKLLPKKIKMESDFLL